MIYFIFGVLFGVFIFEPILINFIYMSNPALFLDLILTEKNRKKLKDEFIFEDELEKRWHDCE